MSCADVEFWLFLLPREFVRILSLRGKIDDITFSWRWWDSFTHLTVAVQRPRCPLLTYLYISSTILQLVCTVRGPVFAGDRNRRKKKKKEEKAARSPLPRPLWLQARRFRQCLLLMISWHESELYKRQNYFTWVLRGYLSEVWPCKPPQALI